MLFFKSYGWGVQHLRVSEPAKTVGKAAGLTFVVLLAVSWGVFEMAGVLTGYLEEIVAGTWDWVSDLLEVVFWLFTTFLIGVVWYLLFVGVIRVFLMTFLDGVVERVYGTRFGNVALGEAPSVVSSILVGVRELVRMLAVHFVLLPIYLMGFAFPGLSFVIFLVVNGWLVAREFYLLVAMRRVEASRVWDTWQRSRVQFVGWGVVFMVGLLIPVVNVVMPAVGAIAMVHLFETCLGENVES